MVRFSSTPLLCFEVCYYEKFIQLFCKNPSHAYSPAAKSYIWIGQISSPSPNKPCSLFTAFLKSTLVMSRYTCTMFLRKLECDNFECFMHGHFNHPTTSLRTYNYTIISYFFKSNLQKE